MINFLKENFKFTNDCIILATPMVLFITVLQVYVDAFRYDLSSKTSYIMFFVALWIGISGCFAGWFYMVKKTLQFSKKTFLFDTDRLTALSKLLLCIFKGVGKFIISFLPVVGAYFIYKVVSFITVIRVYNSPLKPHYNTLTLTSDIITFVIGYFLIYWIPEIIYTYSNPFKALINSVKNSFISFKYSFIYYTLIIAGCLFLQFTIQEMKIYPVVYFFELLFFYYYILYSVITIFRLYERNFIEEN